MYGEASVDRVNFEVAEADEPYGHIPAVDGSAQILGWYSILDEPTIILSDMCVGEPAIEELVKTLSHEYLHFILHKEVNYDACRRLDNIVHNGHFICDREENEHRDTRAPREKWETVRGNRLK